MNKHIAIGIDLAKRIFQLCRVETRSGKVSVNKALSREKLLEFMHQQPPCQVFIEACGGAHFWARALGAMGHQVKLIAPQFVTPFRKGHKTDANDALAIVEAGLRPDMRFVPAKGLAQQDIQSLHRIRERLVKQRTQLINQTQGLLHEYGIVSGRGQKALKSTVCHVLESADGEATALVRELFAEQMEELNQLNSRIDELTKRVQQLARTTVICRELSEIEGIGPITSTLLYSALGDGKSFKNGRQAAAYLGLTPRQSSSGGKVTLCGTGKTGQGQLKAALIRGSHSVIQRVGEKPDGKSRWVRQLIARAGVNKTAVALANKTVRTAWSILHHGTVYRRDYQHTLLVAA